MLVARGAFIERVHTFGYRTVLKVMGEFVEQNVHRERLQTQSDSWLGAAIYDTRRELVPVTRAEWGVIAPTQVLYPSMDANLTRWDAKMLGQLVNDTERRAQNLACGHLVHDHSSAFRSTRSD